MPARSSSSPVLVRQGIAWRFRSLSLIPLWLFVFVHLHVNTWFTAGEEFALRRLGWFSAIPPVQRVLLEVGCLYVPLALHASHGLHTVRNSMACRATHRLTLAYAFYLGQRISGVFLIFFLAFHLVDVRFGSVHASPCEAKALQALSTLFEQPWRRAFYALGSLAIAIHLAAGARTLCLRHGLISSLRGETLLTRMALALMLWCFLVGLAPLVVWNSA